MDPRPCTSLSGKHHSLYWDSKKVDLGKADVFGLCQGIPWQGGGLIKGGLSPTGGFLRSPPSIPPIRHCPQVHFV